MFEFLLMGGFGFFIIIFLIFLILWIKNKKQKSEVCKNCGETKKNKEKYCSKCGNKLYSKKKTIIFSIISLISLIFSLIFLTALALELNLFETIFRGNISNKRNESVAQIKIVTDYIKIRERKSTSSLVLGKVYKGEIFTVISEDEDSRYNWYEIETKNGIKGYVAGKNGITAYVEELPIKGIESIIDENNKTTTTTTTTTKTTTKKKTTKKTTTKKATTKTTTVPTTTTNTKTTTTQTIITQSTTTTTTTQQIIKKVIDAKADYSCSSGELNYKKECVYESYTSDPSIKYTICPSGYEQEKEGSVFCVTETKEPFKATEKTGCSNGDSNLEYVGGQYYCRGGQIVVKHVCPSGYTVTRTSVGVVTSYYCVWSKPTTVRGTEACRDGYKLNSSGKLCYKEIIKEPTITYTCPTGYELKEDKCYEM